MVKCKVPSVEAQPGRVLKALFKILSRVGSSQNDVANSALKVVSAFLR